MLSHGSRPRSAVACAAALVLTVLAVPAFAQNAAAPSVHWGMSAFPEFAQVQQIGLQEFLFTEFGKPGEGRYGDLGEMPTTGFNILSLSNNRVLGRREYIESNLLYSSTIDVGFTHDRFTEFLQNDVQHTLSNIEHVPRGRTHDWAPVLGYTGEVVYRFISTSWTNDGGLATFPTPMFASAGFHLGTMYEEAYASVGLRRHAGPWFLPPWFRRYVYPSISAMVRGGVLHKGFIFQDLSPAYALGQATLALHVAEGWYPILLEFGMSGHSGFFIDVAKQPMAEHFYIGRVSLGDFTFELTNDSFGDKDSGPTVGVRLFMSLIAGTQRSFIQKMLSYL